mgnify:FL=1
MYDNISFYDFNAWFVRDNNSYKDNFSYEGRKALFEYLEDLEDDIGEKIQFDPIALCCEYSEYDNFKQLQENYDNDEITNLETLRDHTTVIEIEDSERFIIQDF